MILESTYVYKKFKYNLQVLIPIGILLASSDALSYTFKDAVDNLKSHDAVEAISNKSLSLREEGDARGSWGDPKFTLAAKNFPKDSFKDDETPMTGVEFGLSQKIALTNKYGNIEESFNLLSKSKKLESENKYRELLSSFWKILIHIRNLKEEIKIFEENKNWITKILKVSKKLYANGKLTQQALLDIQIRNSEIDSSLSNKKFEYKEQMDRLGYLLGFNDQLDFETIPWDFLTKKSEGKDLKELSLKSLVASTEYMLTAKKQSYVPDLTFSVGYTKRANIDGRGDFVSASVSFPLPFSGSKYSQHSQAVHEKARVKKELNNYTKYKKSEVSRLNHESQKISNELKILTESTIKFSENSRKITSKSYGLGQSSYVELLQSELKLQNLLLKRAKLKAELAMNKVNTKFLIGDNLYE